MGVVGATPSPAVVALNFVRPRAPTVTDDAAAGYTIGAHWTNPITQRVWICGSAAAGAAVWVEVVGSTSPPPVSAFLTEGLLVFNYGANVFTDTSRYPYVGWLVLSPNQDANRQAWQAWAAAQPPPKGRLLMYKTLLEAQSAFGTQTYASVATSAAVPQTNRFAAGTSVPTEEVKYHDANFPSDRWQLYDAAGNPLYYPPFNSWLVDGASASYQALAYQYLKGQMLTQGWDGVFFDNILVSSGTQNGGWPYYRKDSSGALVVAYSTPQAWAAATVACLQAVAAQLIADGFYVAANTHWFISGEGASNTGAAENAWWAQVGPHVSMMIAEYCTTVSQGIRRSTDDVAWYDWWLPHTAGLYATSLAAGQCGMGFGAGAFTDLTNIRYAAASMRVTGSGAIDASSAFFTPGWIDAVHKIAWGTKVGGQLVSGSIRAQRWTGGWAVVNTSRTAAASATFTDPVTGLPRTFTNIAAVDSYVGA